MSMANSGWRVARASRTGSKNRRRNTDCQDHCCWAAVPNISADTLVAAVADGMGSAPSSALGSRIAVNAAVRQAVALLHQQDQPTPPERMETILDTAVISARREIENTAADLNVAASSMATTLLLAVHSNGIMATAQVGDGACVVSVQDDVFTTFARPERGEYANETHSLTSRRALQRCQIEIASSEQPVRSIALMTDGMMELTIAQRDHRPHQPFFTSLTQWLSRYPDRPHPNTELAKLLESDQIQQKTDDDTTLLLAVRR